MSMVLTYSQYKANSWPFPVCNRQEYSNYEQSDCRSSKSASQCEWQLQSIETKFKETMTDEFD